MSEPLDDTLADKTVRDYVCSRCWGHLLKFPEPERRWIVKCHACGDETPGYVTKSYAEARRTESLSEAQEVNHLLSGLGVIQKPKSQPTEKTLAELGF